jgi:hypothetical protein
VCVCLRVCVCVCVCVYVCMYICVFGMYEPNLYMYVCMYVCMCGMYEPNVYTYVCMYVCMCGMYQPKLSQHCVSFRSLQVTKTEDFQEMKTGSFEVLPSLQRAAANIRRHLHSHLERLRPHT